MATIQRGRTGTAEFISEVPGPYDNGVEDWGVGARQGTTLEGDIDSNYGGSSFDPQGWNVTPEGVITVPLNAATGEYEAGLALGQPVYTDGSRPYRTWYFSVVAQENWACIAGACNNFGEDPPADIGVLYPTAAECGEHCGSSSSSAQPPGSIRWVCLDGICTQVGDLPSDQGYENEEACILAGCGAESSSMYSSSSFVSEFESYCVSGAGSTEYNGTYHPTGLQNIFETEVWKKEGADLFLYYTGAEWNLSPDYDDNSTVVYQANNFSSTPYVGNYFVQLGVEPGPLVQQGVCTESSSSSSILSSSSSSVELSSISSSSNLSSSSSTISSSSTYVSSSSNSSQSLVSCEEASGENTTLITGCIPLCVWVPPQPTILPILDSLTDYTVVAPTDIPAGQTLTLESRVDGTLDYTVVLTGVSAGEAIITLTACTRYYLRWVIE